MLLARPVLHATRPQLQRRPQRRCHAQARRSQRITAGLPVLGPLLSNPLVVIPWALGSFRLFAGYSKTSFSDALPSKLLLCLLWPLLAATSKGFRDQFKRAVL